MSTTEPVISIHGLALQPRPDAWKPPAAAADKFDVERAFLGDRLGLSKLGINVTQVAPGRTAYPFHSHRANDELFYILSGQGELRLGSARHGVKAGDIVGCPLGCVIKALRGFITMIRPNVSPIPSECRPKVAITLA